MKRLRIITLIAVISGFVSLACLPSIAETAKTSKTSKVDALFQKFLKELNQLEEKYPSDQHAFFQLRNTVNGMFQEAKSASSAPGDSQQSFQASLSRLAPGADPQSGIDLYVTCKNLRDQPLRQELQRIISHQYPVGYQQAQDIIFTKLDNHDGEVECVYTGRKIHTNSEPPATDMNVEHSWPQSQGATGDAKCDLHHLFPTDSHANNIRGSFPFGKVDRPTWEEGGSKFDGSTFEIRSEQKGNTARALFYFSIRYGKQIPNDEEAVLRQWAKEDPPDAGEKDRNDRIENFQHNRNPFIDHPEYADQIADF